MGVSPAGRRNDRGRIIGGGYLRLPPTEHSFKVHCDHTHYGTVSSIGEASGVTGGQLVAVTGRLRLRRYSYGGLGGGIYGGRGGYE